MAPIAPHLMQLYMTMTLIVISLLLQNLRINKKFNGPE